LRYFDLIVPCGIAGKRAASLERVLGRAVKSKEVAPKLVAQFGDVFGRNMVRMPPDQLEDALKSQEARASATEGPEEVGAKGSQSWASR
jgi:lipoate-protein ligase B